MQGIFETKLKPVNDWLKRNDETILNQNENVTLV